MQWRIGILLGLCGAVLAAEPARTEDLTVTLQGQRNFLNGSIAFCNEHVPAMQAQLARAQELAEREIGKAEDIIAKAIAPTIMQDKPYLDRFLAMWKKNGDDLVAALKKQDAVRACPTLRDNWEAVTAEVMVEDWENYLFANQPQAAGVR